MFLSLERLEYWYPQYNNPLICDIHRTSDLYKRIRASIEEEGIVNPLLVIKDGSKYKVKIGNNRLRVATDMGISKVPVIVMKDENEWKELKKNYEITSAD